jgi:hypothetical protein
MHIRAITSGALFLITSVSFAATTSPFRDLKELYLNKQYFELRDALKDQRGDKPTDLLFYQGVVSNKFNQPKLSITYFKKYLEQAQESSASELLVECYEMLADDYRKTYQYKKAAAAYTVLVTKYANKVDAKKKSDLENAVKLWGSIK